MKTKNIFFENSQVTPSDRCNLLKQKGKVFWLTGLSGSGKSTLAIAAERQLYQQGFLVYRLDGDNLRYGLNNDLGFGEKDRQENVRRASEVAALFKDTGVIVLATFISPMQNMRDNARNVIGTDDFYEIYIKADLGICRERDTKGLYAKAEKGEIQDFTGISSPYEEPLNPDLMIDTGLYSIDESVERMVDFIKKRIEVVL